MKISRKNVKTHNSMGTPSSAYYAVRNIVCIYKRSVGKTRVLHFTRCYELHIEQIMAREARK